jgi:thiamine biosynthesis lipoprotein
MKSYRLLLPMVVIGAVLGVVALRSLRDTEEPYSDSRVMMDTFVEVTLWGQGRVSPQAAADSAFAAMDRIDSLFRGGLIETSNDSGLVSTSEFRDLLEVSRQVYAATQSEFDPTIGSVSRLWHFWDGARPPEADSLAEALRRVGLERYLDDPSGSWVLDFGGVAKGYAVDRAASVIASLGFKSAIINAGGDLRLVGRRTDGKPWRIAIRHPRRPGSFIGYLDLEDAAVATSGDYEKGGAFITSLNLPRVYLEKGPIASRWWRRVPAGVTLWPPACSCWVRAGGSWQWRASRGRKPSLSMPKGRAWLSAVAWAMASGGSRLTRITISDMAVLLLLVAVGIALLVGGRPDGSAGQWVEIRTLSGELLTLDLNRCQEVEVRGRLGLTKIAVSDRSVSFLESPCPHQLCVRKGKITRSGEWIACIPNGVVARIVGQAEYDGITP